jgi:hypothetical protein
MEAKVVKALENLFLSFPIGVNFILSNSFASWDRCSKYDPASHFRFAFSFTWQIINIESP